MLPRCGRAAHICGANLFLRIVFPAAIAFFEPFQFAIDYLYETSYKFGQGNGAIAARWQAKAGVEPPFAGRERPVFLREVSPRKTNCIRFGRIASLSAYVLFARGCLFLNYFSIFLRFQFVRSFYVFGMANSCLLLLDFNTISSKPLLRRAACPPFLKDALPFCPFGTFPHTVGNHPPRRAEPARPQLPAARILQPLSISSNILAIHPAEIVHLPDKTPVLPPAP